MSSPVEVPLGIGQMVGPASPGIPSTVTIKELQVNEIESMEG